MSQTHPSLAKDLATAAAPCQLSPRRPGGLVWLAILAAATLAGGCSGGRRGVELVGVSGTLTCEGGPMPAASGPLRVSFDVARRSEKRP